MAGRTQFAGAATEPATSALKTSTLKTPAAGALLLHLAVFGSIFGWAFIQGHLHHEYWGSNTEQGAIQATLVSRAPALPLPQDQPPTPNVLATDTPSPAPVQEAPQPKAAPVPEPEAIPIPVKQTPKPTPAKKEQVQPKQPTKKELENARAALHPQPVPRQDNRAQYGQAAPQVSRSMADHQGPESTVTTPGGDFGSRFPWYVNVIKRKVAQNGHQQEVDPRTPVGARVYILFDVSRDGVPSIQSFALLVL